MSVANIPGRGRPTGLPLDALLSAVLGRRVRGLSIEVRGGRLVLRGRADSFHVKQLAQHAAMAVTELPLAANEIEVAARPRRRVVLASGDDRVRAAGRARLAADGWEVATACDGLECVVHLRQAGAEVVVLDANLLWGGADGVLEHIADGAPPAIPVVFLGNPPHRPAGGGTAVVAILEKPVDADTLALAVAATRDGRLTGEEW